MNPFRDDLPEIGRCPACGHDGEGLEFAFPDPPADMAAFTQVQAACLSCGIHGAVRGSYGEAIDAFRAGEFEIAA